MTEIELKPKSYDELSRALIEATTDNLFLEDENKHLKSIIKESREYIEEKIKDYKISQQVCLVQRDSITHYNLEQRIKEIKDILQILDKENNSW